MPQEYEAITAVLNAAVHGEAGAVEQLWRLVYSELKQIARSQIAAEAPGRTLQPTALLHEAFFRLFGKDDVEWENRRHFFAAAAKAMRQIRIDDARRRNRLKRGGESRRVELGEEPPIFAQDPAEVLAVHEALAQLEKIDERQAQVVALRYFAGLTVEECAAALDISSRSVVNEWRLARAWLYRRLST